MKAIHYILCAAFCSVTACTDWDDHYEGNITDGGNMTLWEQMQQREELSDFCEVLEHTKLFRMHKKTKASYAEILNSGQSFTVMAPVNGTFDKQSLIDMTATDRGDSIVERTFVLNHIARSANSATSGEKKILMMNGKRTTVGRDVVNGVKITENNLHAKNGILHLMSDKLPYYMNLYEQMTDREEFKAIGDVPPTEATDLWKTYQATVEQFYDQLKVNKDLRDYDFRKNLELKTLLCEEAEKLDADDDVVLAFKRLQNLHDEWRQTGPVAKELREEIWQRFKDASAVVNKKYQAFFEERKAREAANEQAKTAICERVEAIDCNQFKSFGAWEEATKTIIAAQQEWKTLGFASRKVNNALFARFRKACDNFFTLKGEYYRAVKDELAANLAKKIALCEQAEALSESTDWRRTADRLVALQKEWKTIGTVAKKQSDAVWQRFQKACDTFFEARKRNQSEGRSEEQANLKAKREIIEALKAIGADTPRAEAMPKVKELQARWQEIGHVPFREKDKIYDEYRALCDAFYSRARRDGAGASRFEDVVKEMSGDAAKLRRERDRIVRAYEIKRNELKTYENNLGFLSSKSKSGDSMVREMERRIQRIKDDLAAIEQKIALIDAQL